MHYNIKISTYKKKVEQCLMNAKDIDCYLEVFHCSSNMDDYYSLALHGAQTDT
jgi:hypothetical protein